METNQPIQAEMQQDMDINARLALISQAVAAKLNSTAKSVPGAEAVVNHEPNVLAVSTCPIDPMERLLCDSCQ